MLSEKSKSVVVVSPAMEVDSHIDVTSEDALPGEPLGQTVSTTENYPSGIRLAFLLSSIYLTVFLIALDRTIIATAIPVITDTFQSAGDIGWYNSAFLLPATALQLFFGRLYTFYSPKWIFMTLVVVFQVGSALCGAAPNSIAFIGGRAIAGIGAGGLYNGSLILMTTAIPLKKRPFYTGLLGACVGVASVAGPLVGGAFTTKLSWRWCFYSNLPVGTLVLAFLYLDVQSKKPVLADLSWKEKIVRIDIPGTLIFVPCMISLLLAFQWGGSTYSWADARIISLLVVFGVLLILFVGIQLWRKEYATVPPRIVSQQTMAIGVFYNFFGGASVMLTTYYVPIWFQAIKGDSAIESGISTLPSIISTVVASIGSGMFVRKIGYYNPTMLASGVICAIGAGLMTLLKPATAHPLWIACQIVYGLGTGLSSQHGSLAAQTVLSKEDVPTGISVMLFAQGLGGTIGVPVGEVIVNNRLIAGLQKLGDIDPQAVVSTGATDLRNMFSADQLANVVNIYNDAIVHVFYATTVFACLGLVTGILMPWKTTKTSNKKVDAEQAD